MSRVLAPVLALALLLVAAPPASAAYSQFRTPSGNIACVMDSRSVRCDIYETDNALPKRPSWCDLDYGHSYGITRNGNRGRRLCTSDAVGQPPRILGYGGAIRRGKLTCKSRTSGLTCRNAKGHGFRLSRQRQRVF